MLIPLCPRSRSRGSGPGWVRCPLGQRGKLAQQPGPHRSARAPPLLSPRAPPGPLRGQEYLLDPTAWELSHARWREAAQNWATGQGAGPARPSWLSCALPSTLILTDCAQLPSLAALRPQGLPSASCEHLGRRFGFSGSAEHHSTTQRAPGPPGPVRAGGASTSWHSRVSPEDCSGAIPSPPKAPA